MTSHDRVYQCAYITEGPSEIPQLFWCKKFSVPAPIFAVTWRTE